MGREEITMSQEISNFSKETVRLRFADHDAIGKAAEKAYEEDPILAVKLFFQIGDIRGGKGERDIFNACMDFLVEKHPSVAVELLPLIPLYTRWDYLLRLTDSDNEEIATQATKLITEQFHDDLRLLQAGETAHISMLAKWMPSLQADREDKSKARRLLKALKMQDREYLKALTTLREYLNTLEKRLASKSLDSIMFERMTSIQQLRYSNYLKNVMSEKRHSDVQAVLRGEASWNAQTLNPLDVCHDYLENDWSGEFDIDEDFEALWSLIPDSTSGNGKTLVVRDGSGSMTRLIGKDTAADMLEASSALAIYFAEKLNGPLKNKFLTFSENPQIVDMSQCANLAERLRTCYRYDECANVDVRETYDVLLNAAVSEGLKQEELPAYLLILNDMEFDTARGADWDEDHAEAHKTLFNAIHGKWKEAGYQAPTLVFWNLSVPRVASPEIDSENGVIFLNGFSKDALAKVMAGEFDQISETAEEKSMEDPMAQLLQKLSRPRYAAVEQAVIRALKN